MAKYKLVKDYPGRVAEVGDVIKWSSDIGNYIADIAKDSWMYKIDKNEVEDYPEFWEEIKEPLFKTIDGVDIYEGDSFWIANSYKWSVWENDSNNNWVGNQDYVHKFSTKEAAERFIEENKPKYSEKDMIDFGHYVIDDIISGLVKYNIKWRFNIWRLKNNIDEK